MTILDAIEARHSEGAYKDQSLSEEIVRLLEDEIVKLNHEGQLHIQLICNEPKAFQGTLAKYGKFRNANNYLVMAGKKTEDKVVALARICPAGTHMKEISIGMVITTERGKGYGKQILLHAIDAAIEHFDAKRIDIEAQEYAKGFYESVGFRQSSDTFMLDGIPHIKMTWKNRTDN